MGTVPFPKVQFSVFTPTWEQLELELQFFSQKKNIEKLANASKVPVPPYIEAP